MQTEFQNSMLCPITYGAVLDAIAATESDPFRMTIRNREEWSVIAACVNQGIDSHLEAISNGPDEFLDDGSCAVTPHNLCVLLRRLSEVDDHFGRMDCGSMLRSIDVAASLQESILAVLGFDDGGTYVGREALGLD